MLDWIGLPGLILLAVFPVAVLNTVAFWRILPRAGLPSALAFLALFPVIGNVLFWIMAFMKWPGDET